MSKLNAALSCVCVWVALVTPLYAADPVVSNVRASQRDGTKLVDIWYNVADADGDRLNVSVAATVNGAPIAASSFSGHVGPNVTPGNNRRVVWDAGADWAGQFSSAVRFTITADDGATPTAGNYMVIDLSAGPSASSYPVSYLNAVPAGGWTDEYKTTKLVMRKIPAGSFTMGSPSGELGHNGGDERQHSVTLTKDFYIGVFEVTQKQWERVMGNWPSYFTNASYRETRPVEQVSYYDVRENPTNSAISPHWPQSSQVHADSFMGKLRAKTGLSTFDLPTEAQWEYACRAGTTTALNSGHNITNILADARMAEVGRYRYNHPGGYSESSSVSINGGTAKVGSYLPNAWGLYDMHGNVYEWCLDWFLMYYGTVTDPPGAVSGSYRIVRSGGMHSPAAPCRSAKRSSSVIPVKRYNYFGFRISRTLP